MRAARLLRDVKGDAVRARIAEAANDSASPELRDTLLRIADGEPLEALREDAADALDAESAEGTKAARRPQRAR